MRPHLAFLLALFPPATAAAQVELPRTHRPGPTAPAITPGDLMTRLYILADDSMQGREAGTPGNVKGTAYIAAEIKRAGLVPAGDDGTYFQTIPLRTRTFDTTSTFALAGAPLTAPSAHRARRQPGGPGGPGAGIPDHRRHRGEDVHDPAGAAHARGDRHDRGRRRAVRRRAGRFPGTQRGRYRARQ